MANEVRTLDEILAALKTGGGIDLEFDDWVMNRARKLEASGELQEILDEDGDIEPSAEAWRKIDEDFPAKDMADHLGEYGEAYRYGLAQAEELLMLIKRDRQRELAALN